MTLEIDAKLIHLTFDDAVDGVVEPPFLTPAGQREPVFNPAVLISPRINRDMSSQMFVDTRVTPHRFSDHPTVLGREDTVIKPHRSASVDSGSSKSCHYPCLLRKYVHFHHGNDTIIIHKYKYMSMVKFYVLSGYPQNTLQFMA